MLSNTNQLGTVGNHRFFGSLHVADCELHCIRGNTRPYIPFDCLVQTKLFVLIYSIFCVSLTC